MLKTNNFFYESLSENMKENYQKTVEILNNAEKNKKITSNNLTFAKKVSVLLFTINFKKSLNDMVLVSEENKKKKSYQRFHNQKITSFIQLGKTKKLAEEMVKDGIMNYGVKAKQILCICEEINKKIKEVNQFESKTVKNEHGELVEILKEKKTCPCCFRKVEVNAENKIVHHGYQRIYGFKTESCFGQGKLCFEVSDSGTWEYIENLATEKEKLIFEIEKLKTTEKIEVEDKTTKKIEVFSTEDKFFKQVQKSVIENINFEIERIDVLLNELKNKVKKRV